jgi:phosphoribosylanthranilate isomerase
MAKIKICGLFREEDIGFVNESLPDYIGFVFAPSHRQVSESRACFLRQRLASGITPVGVFVNAAPDAILRLCRDGVIAAVQLHGGEDESYIGRLKARCSLPVIKAIRCGGAAARAGIGTCADYFLFDSGKGGTGVAFNWSRIPPVADGTPWFLAGGITVNTIADALSRGPYCVDVSSGAETDGIKDKDKIRELVHRVRLIR